MALRLQPGQLAGIARLLAGARAAGDGLLQFVPRRGPITSLKYA